MYYIKYDTNSNGLYTNFVIEKEDASCIRWKSSLMDENRNLNAPLLYFENRRDAEEILYMVLEHNNYSESKTIEPIRFIADLYWATNRLIDDRMQKIYDTIDGIKIEDIIKYQQQYWAD